MTFAAIVYVTISVDLTVLVYGEAFQAHLNPIYAKEPSKPVAPIVFLLATPNPKT